MLGNGDIAEGLAVDALDVIRAKQVHVLVALSQLEGDIWNDDAQGERLDADLLVCVFALGVQEGQDVRVVCGEVNRPRALTRAQLVGVGERILQQLHHRDHA